MSVLIGLTNVVKDALGLTLGGNAAGFSASITIEQILLLVVIYVGVVKLIKWTKKEVRKG